MIILKDCLVALSLIFVCFPAAARDETTSTEEVRGNIERIIAAKVGEISYDLQIQIDGDAGADALDNSVLSRLYSDAHEFATLLIDNPVENHISRLDELIVNFDSTGKLNGIDPAQFVIDDDRVMLHLVNPHVYLGRNLKKTGIKPAAFFVGYLQMMEYVLSGPEVTKVTEVIANIEKSMDDYLSFTPYNIKIQVDHENEKANYKDSETNQLYKDARKLGEFIEGNPLQKYFTQQFGELVVNFDSSGNYTGGNPFKFERELGQLILNNPRISKAYLNHYLKQLSKDDIWERKKEAAPNRFFSLVGKVAILGGSAVVVLAAIGSGVKNGIGVLVPIIAGYHLTKTDKEVGSDEEQAYD